MKSLLRKSVAVLSCLLLLNSQIFSVHAISSNAESTDSSVSVSSETEENITLTVSIFENSGRGWILNPIQLTCPQGSGLTELIETLERYAYLEDAVISNGQLLSLTDDAGTLYDGGPDQEDEWLMILNGIEQTSLKYTADENGNLVDFAFQDGDTLQLVFSSTDTSDMEMQSVSTPSHSLSTADDVLPWDAEYDNALRAGCGWLKTNSNSALALTTFGAIGYTVDYKYLTRILRNIYQQQTPTGIELALNILCVSFCGISAENFSSNLLEQLISFPDLDRIATVYGLLAYDCNSYDVPADALNSRDAMLNVIMAGQNPDGGIANIQGEESDVFLTALSLVALAPYRNDQTVGPCIDKALEWLATQQDSNGFYHSEKYESCQATSAVILALSSLSISLTDERFCTNGHNLMDALMQFNVENSGFSEQLDDSPSVTATELALLAICSQKTGRNPLILRSPVTGNGSIDFSSSSEISEEESSAPSAIDNSTRSRIHTGLIGGISGVSIGIVIMLAVLLHLKNKYKSD